MKKIILFILCYFTMIVYTSAQVWKVDQLTAEIESGVDKVNNKARAKDIDGALNDLNKLNTDLRNSLPEFPDWYKAAREKERDYNFRVNAELAPQFEVQYWRTMLQKVEQNKKGLNEAFRGIEAMKTLDSQDLAWSYLKTIYNAGKAIKDVVENAATGSLGSLFFNTKEGMDQFIEDYKNIENAALQGLETEQQEQELKLMISKAKAAERNYKRIEEKISNGFTIVESFTANVDRLRQTTEKLSQQAQYKIDWNDSRYNFYGDNYLQRIEQEKGRLESSYINWSTFKNTYLSIGNKAKQERSAVLAAIQKTDDVAVKQAKADDVEVAYEEYSKMAFETFREVEQQYGTTITEKINLNYQIEGFKPVPYPTGQNIESGFSASALRISSVQAEADVQEFINLVHAEVNGINELVNRKQMETAVNRLNVLNRRFDKELGFSFAENYRKAREDNPNFTVQINAQLSGSFNGAYWENSLKQNAARLNDLRDRYYATPKSNARRYWEITYALCKSAYDLAQLKPDVAKELKESGKKAAWDKFEEGTNGIEDDFKKIKKAFEMEYNTPENKAAIEALMKKVANTANALEGLASYMKVNEEEATRFYALVDRFNSIKKEIESGPNKRISADDARYNFDETTFYKRAEQFVNEFKDETLSWTEFDQKLNQLNIEAEQQKEEVIKNIKASDDLESKKQQAINTETNDWDYYNSWAIKEHGECFELNKQAQNDTGINAFAGAEETPQNNTVGADPFAGSPAENNTSKQGSNSLSTPEYSWNGQSYLNQIKNLANQFKQDGTDYYVLKNKIENVNRNAEQAKDQIFQKIQNSGAADSFEKGEQLEADFNEFYDLSFDILDDSYRFDQNKPVVEIGNTKQNSGHIDRQTQSGTSTVPTPPGNRIKNVYFHGLWTDTRENTRFMLSLTQKGNSVKIDNVGTGKITDGVLKYSGQQWDGTSVYYEYRLKGDGYTIERLSRNYGKENSVKYIFKASKKSAGEFVYSDNDNDGVVNRFDNCPNTPDGLTVDNGGVDLMGCPTRQRQTAANNPSVSHPTTETLSDTNNPFAGSSAESSSSTNSGSTSNPFAGSPAKKKSSINSGSTSNPFAGASTQTNTSTKILPQTSTVSNTSPVSPPGLVGTASNNGNGKGSYCTLDIKKLRNTDILEFYRLSGKMEKVEVIWRTSGGSWQTQYTGPRTKFTVSEFIKDISDYITHLIFTVNAHHNSSYTATACKIEVWHLPAGGSIPSRPQTPMANLGDEKLMNNFNELISKADEAFNRKYWNESQGTRASSNPKQESLDLLRKAELLIAQQKDVLKQYSMVLKLAGKYADYAKRVFANSAKVEFIEAAGKMLAQYGNKANSTGTEKAKAFD